MSYKKIDDADIAYLKSLVDEKRFFVGDQISEDYSHDELGGAERMPDVLIQVLSAEEIASVLSYANEKRIPVVMRGAGTGLVGASVAVEGGIMMETTKMNRILELDEKNMTMTVEPGVLLMEVAAYAAEHGYMYPPDPGEKAATIGGNINTNAGGLRAVKYGVTREYVRGMTIVTPEGKTMQFGGKVVKNSSGYSLKDLIIGSEGTLAVVTQAILKLIPTPTRSVSLLIPFKDMEAALDMVPWILKSKITPTAMEYCPKDFIQWAEEYVGKLLPDQSAEHYLLLTFEGSDAMGVEKEYETIADVCLDNGALDVLLVDTDERKGMVWGLRSAFLDGLKSAVNEIEECDVVVPRDRIAEYFKFAHELAQKLKVRIPKCGHAGDGNVHIYVCKDDMTDEEYQQKVDEAFDALYAKAEEMGGMVSGEHGIGWAKKGFLAKQCGPDVMAIMQGIKKVFDPNNILNPGKVVQ